MPQSTGKLLVIEGLEGAGKSTAVQCVVTLLSEHGINSITTREPGGTAIGEVLRAVIKNPEYSGILADKTELLLLYAARIQLLEQVIKPALARGEWVVADRFELSTFAYQGGGREMGLQQIEALSAFCLQGFKPDLTIYLDISAQVGMQRVRSRGAIDRIEQQSIDFFQRVQDMYNRYVHSHPAIVRIDASQSIEAVSAAIKQKLQPFIEQNT